MSPPRWTSVVNPEIMHLLIEKAADPRVTERFWAKVDKRTIDYEDDCWIWTAGLSSEGYGVFSVSPERGRRHVVRAHRAAWFFTYPRPIEHYHYLDHLFPVCRGRYCVNPMHLEPVDKDENDRRRTSTTSAAAQRARRYEHLLERDNRDLDLRVRAILERETAA